MEVVGVVGVAALTLAVAAGLWWVVYRFWWHRTGEPSVPSRPGGATGDRAPQAPPAGSGSSRSGRGAATAAVLLALAVGVVLLRRRRRARRRRRRALAACQALAPAPRAASGLTPPA